MGRNFELVEVDRGINDVRIATVTSFNALFHETRIRDEMSDALGSLSIKLTDIRHNAVKEEPTSGAADFRAFHVMFLLIPKVAGRRVAITNVRRARRVAQALDDARVAAHDEIDRALYF